ncbi:MAG: hypothetical protein WCG23_12005 [bacterium]
MTNSPAQKRLFDNVLVKKKQNASRSLNNYMEQLKIHFDLNDRDLIKVLEITLKEKRNKNFIKKWWHILK